MHRYFGQMIIILFLILFIQNCSSARFPVRQALEDQSQLDRYLQISGSRYPNTYSLSQRIILTIRGKQYDFLGQLIMDKETGFRAIAYGEMGGLFLDLLYRDGNKRILANPSSLPEKPLVEGVVPDILRIFDSRPGKGYLFRTENGQVGIRQDISGDTVCDYIFDESTGLLKSLSEGKKNKEIRKIRFEGYKNLEHASVQLPGVIIVENLEWHYRMEIRLLDLKREIDRSKAFLLEE